MESVKKIQAKLSDVRIAPRKVRLIAAVVRNMTAEAAIDQLSFLPRKSAEPIRKLLLSAVANAEHNAKVKKEDLIIERLIVSKGSTLKRWQPRAQGRATPIHKKCSHVTVVLKEKAKPIVTKKSMPKKNKNLIKKDKK